MTAPLSDGLNYCYSLMYAAEQHQRRGCGIKAMLCYENCRKKAMKSFTDEVYSHCLLRASRKECQILISLGLQKRAYSILKAVYSRVSPEFHSMDKLLVLAQLADLAVLYEEKSSLHFKEALDFEVRVLSEY